MNIIALGANYITEIFTLVARALSAGFGWFQDLLDAFGLPWEIYSLVLIGFAVTGYIVSSVFSQFRDSADDAVRSTYIYSVREFKKGNKKEE